jgi:hypothetical protein
MRVHAQIYLMGWLEFFSWSDSAALERLGADIGFEAKSSINGNCRTRILIPGHCYPLHPS